MKRLFGGPSSVAQTPPTSADSLSRSDTYGSHLGPLPSSTPAQTAQRTPLYQRNSFTAPSATSQTGSHVYPHTPSASSTITATTNIDYFPHTPSLSPINSRQGASTAYSTQFAAPLQSSTAPPLTPVQFLVPQTTGAASSSQPPQIVTSAMLADPNTSITNMQAHAIDRSDLHKGVKALESVLVSFDEYRDLKMRLVKCEKKLAKGLSELGRAKAFEDVPSQTLQAASDVLEASMDVSAKQAKLIQKEYEAVNEHCSKYFKRIAKEEKAFDEQLETLDGKIKKAHASHDKNVKKGGIRSAVESHDKFIQTIQALTADVTRIKTAHSASVGQRTFLTSLMVAATMGGLADVEFKSLCESVRKAGQHVGTLHQWLNLTANDAMAKVQPVDVSDDACAGLAQRIAAKEAEIRDEWQRQEQARFKQLEEEHAILALQQLGWTPPLTAAAAAPHSEPANKASSTSTSAQPPPNDDKTTMTSTPPTKTLANLPKLDSNGNLIDKVESAVQRTSRASPANPADEGDEYSPATSGESQSSGVHRLQQDLSLTDEAIDVRDSSSEAKNNVAALPSAAAAQLALQTNKTADTDSDETNSASSSSSLSASGSSSSATSKGSEDAQPAQSEPKSVGPLTTIEEKADDDVPGRQDEDADTTQALLYRGSSSPANERQNEEARSSSQQQHNAQQRDSSIWERERERERNIELERRLAEAENRLRTLDRRPISSHSSIAAPTTGGARAYGDSDPYGQSTATTSYDGYLRNGADARRPRHSEPARNCGSHTLPSLQQQRAEDELTSSRRYGAERYAPAVGSSRIAGPSLARSLSTDSERSFVARMKAMYQSEKVDKQVPPQQKFDAAATSPHRVPDLAMAYTSYSNNSNSNRILNSTASTQRQNANVRGRYDSAPSESLRIDATSGPGRRAADVAGAPAHSSSCGCWHCSARHYRSVDSAPSATQGASISMATTKAGIVPPHPPPRHPSATPASRPAPPPNYRRQTMQVPPHAFDVQAYDDYDGHDVNALAAPSFDDGKHYSRRSLDDEPGRRVTYAKEHGTVR